MIKTAQDAYLAGRQAATEKLADWRQEAKRREAERLEALRQEAKREFNKEKTMSLIDRLLGESHRAESEKRITSNQQYDGNWSLTNKEIDEMNEASARADRDWNSTLVRYGYPPSAWDKEIALANAFQPDPTPAPPKKDKLLSFLDKRELPYKVPPTQVEKKELPTTALNIASVLAGTAGGSYLGGFTPRSLGVSLGGAAAGNLLGMAAGAGVNAFTNRESELIPLIGSTTGAIGGGLAAGKYLS